MNEKILILILLLVLAGGMYLQKFIGQRPKTIVQVTASIIMLMFVWLGDLFKGNITLKIIFSLLVLINVVYLFWKCRKSMSDNE